MGPLPSFSAPPLRTHMRMHKSEVPFCKFNLRADTNGAAKLRFPQMFANGTLTVEIRAGWDILAKISSCIYDWIYLGSCTPQSPIGSPTANTFKGRSQLSDLSADSIPNWISLCTHASPGLIPGSLIILNILCILAPPNTCRPRGVALVKTFFGKITSFMTWYCGKNTSNSDAYALQLQLTWTRVDCLIQPKRCSRDSAQHWC